MTYSSKLAFVFGRGFVLTGNLNILTPEFLIPVAKYHPGFLITRFMFTCPVLLYISSLSAATLFGYEVRFVPGYGSYCSCCLCAAGCTRIYRVLGIIALSMRYLVPGAKYIPYLTSD